MLDELRKKITKNFKDDSFRNEALGLSLGLLLTAFVAYIAASTITTFFVPMLLEGAVKSSIDSLAASVSGDLPEVERINYRTIEKSVLKRNIFNMEGKFPDEKLESEESSEQDFDMTAPCLETNLNISLLGTIFLDSENSLAVVKESGVDESDIYAAGDLIIGSEKAHIAAVSRNMIVINNGGRKECINIGSEEDADAVDQGGGADTVRKEFSVTFDASFVDDELGSGFGKIIQSARLIPNMVGSKVDGYKMFAIQKGSLLDKAGFKDGDVLIQVNSLVMEAEQGFALYQALQDDKEISVHLLREGKTPTNIKIMVK